MLMEVLNDISCKFLGSFKSIERVDCLFNLEKRIKKNYEIKSFSKMIQRICLKFGNTLNIRQQKRK